ncbi:MAG: DUF1501 domain-containing protein, partial [Planctomycetota bacterium]
MNPFSPAPSPRRALLDRRAFVGDAATAVAGMALASLLDGDGALGAAPPIDPAQPFAARAGHFAPRARRVLVIFCAGAVSQLETWDWKPHLVDWDDRPLPGG